MKHATPARFADVCLSLGVGDEDAQCIHADLVRRYSQAQRSYHNLSHIDRMLAWLDTAGNGSDSVELAIWFHDAVYEPLGSHNEAKSARYFRDQLGPFIGETLADDVERLIEATDPSRPRSGRQDEDLVIDIDLSILGASAEEYARYRHAIRSEYSSVPEADFVVGRSAILRTFLSRRIYSTGFFQRLEEPARANIAAELAALEMARG